MSIWTHVNGSIRIDGAHTYEENEEQTINNIVGEMINYNELAKLDIMEEPQCDLPMGSEGSLQYKFVFYGEDEDLGDGCESHSMSRGSILIWGDLRDYDTPNEIVAWFKNLLTKIEKSNKGFFIREALIDVYTEGNNRLICVKKQTDDIEIIEVSDKFVL